MKLLSSTKTMAACRRAPGEIVVRGPSVIPEYFRDEAATRRAIRNGWFYTGDIGKLDHDGYLFLTGRRSEFINRGGEKIAPDEVDEILLSHPSVDEALTFPIPRRSGGGRTWRRDPTAHWIAGLGEPISRPSFRIVYPVTRSPATFSFRGRNS